MIPNEIGHNFPTSCYLILRHSQYQQMSDSAGYFEAMGEPVTVTHIFITKRHPQFGTGVHPDGIINVA